MHNYAFDILLRSFHLSAKLYIPNIHKNIKKKTKGYLYNTSWVFGFWQISGHFWGVYQIWREIST